MAERPIFVQSRKVVNWSMKCHWSTVEKLAGFRRITGTRLIQSNQISCGFSLLTY